MKKLSILFGAALLLVASGFAYSQLAQQPQQRPCGETSVVASILSKDFGESLILHGTVEGTAFLSLWASKETKTWTIVLTTGDKTCYITSGTNFRLLGTPI